jgi:hypothetical protein
MRHRHGTSGSQSTLLLLISTINSHRKSKFSLHTLHTGTDVVWSSPICQNTVKSYPHYTNFYILTSKWFNYYKHAEYISLYCTLMRDCILKHQPVGYGFSRYKSFVCSYTIGTKCPSVYVEHCITSDRSGLAPLTWVCSKERLIQTDVSVSVFLSACLSSTL